MMKKPAAKVRRNLTLDTRLAYTLEVVSAYTDFSQGKIVEMAFAQPIMQRLFAFLNPASGNALASLLDAYQRQADHMDSRAGERLLIAVRQWMMDDARKEMKENLGLGQLNTNAYIHGHMTKGSRNADPYFERVYDLAGRGEFLHPDMDGMALKNRVIEYLNAMLAGPDDKDRMGEPYLYRNLVMILQDYFLPPTETEVMHLFFDLSDGYVLPWHSSAAHGR